MPRYYLSVRYRDRLFRDEEGEDMPSGIEMKVRALEAARDLIRTPFLAIPDWLDHNQGAHQLLLSSAFVRD